MLKGDEIIKYYTSDLHFGHGNIIGFDNRPFNSVDEMNKTMIANWNSVVSDNDEVYILGDMFWHNEEAPDILSTLKGRKYLILGNHDRINSQMKDYFVWVKEIETIKDGDNHVVLCHYPIAHWKNQYYGYIHLYGHIHNTRDTRPFELYKKMCVEDDIPFKAYNVGCMLWDYTPRTLEEILERNGG